MPCSTCTDPLTGTLEDACDSCRALLGSEPCVCGGTGNHDGQSVRHCDECALPCRDCGVAFTPYSPGPNPLDGHDYGPAEYCKLCVARNTADLHALAVLASGGEYADRAARVLYDEFEINEEDRRAMLAADARF